MGHESQSITGDVTLWQPNRVTVGICDQKVAIVADTNLVTYALGSCVAIMLHDANRRAAGLLHFMLPDSSLNPSKAEMRPGMFADTGLKALLQELSSKGILARNLTARLVGGGALKGMGATFAIGTNNQAAARSLLEAARIRVVAEDLGGNRSRSVFMHAGSGRVLVRSPSGEYEL